ncbi:MAG: L-fucose/L-arabinose isomerase family protein [Ruminococcus sp.]|nr:L-fucose/L-arabinose isomerase family protein [Ruminococcus sp.]
MENMPEVKLGICAVSRDCFPANLSEGRRRQVVKACREANVDIYECPTVVESERDMLKALEEIKAAGVNALVVYLGNFGPETAETLLAKKFAQSCGEKLPVMFAAAAEESGDNLIGGRGDAYCGMLNASYNMGLRGVKAYIPEYPVGTPNDVTKMIEEFIPIARAVLGLARLKVISFGPRPQDFLACNAPIARLYDIGVEIEENSELDLFAAFNEHKGDSRIDAVVKDMEEELGDGNKMSGILPKLAQYELTLLDWADAHKGSREYVVFANKCWPSFQTQFGFVPCYVNSRLTGRGIPVACEVDIWGAVSEYIGQCVSDDAVTLLDINNTVPADIYESEIKGKTPYSPTDVFMGFHCGNTAAKKLRSREMKYQLIMHRGLEPDKEPDITRGTLEGDLIPSDITFFRLQSNADTELTAYAAEGEILPVATRSFGGIGIFAVNEMGRFYRHVLIEGRFPHHGAVTFGHNGKAVFEVFKLLGVKSIGFNQPKGMLYKTENPFRG